MMTESESAVDDIENIFEPQFDDQEQETAIQILDLHKRYRNYGGSKIVLNGLNLNCQTGKLYILYGTAKSGKSAVVKSILNIEPYSRGAVAIFSKNSKHSYGVVGYMPQSVGLDASLTAIETINYFAMLQKLNRHDCAKKFSAMQSPMTISEFSTLVKHLNEDQRRVLSFYVAIMASPRIVVLDQPVAGCDPLYKQFFWQIMRNLVDNEEKTVLMTCSDEIDVKYADTVGYLRNGQIIVEESPSDLMKRYNIWSFHDLILSISVAELKQFQIIEAEKTQVNDDVSIKSGGFVVTHFTSNDEAETVPNEKVMFNSSYSCYSHHKNVCRSFSMTDVLKQLWVLIKWQALISVRNYFKVLVHFLLPTLCVLFYGYSNDMTEVNVGIVYCGNESCQLVGDPPICDFERRFSTKYLAKSYYESYEEAAKRVDSGELSAILLLNNDSKDTAFNKNMDFGCQSTAFTKTNIVLEMGYSSKLIRSHIIDQLSRAYGGSEDNPLIPSVVTFSESLTDNAYQCLNDCPVTPFMSIFKSTARKYESEVMHLIWGAVATISHFSGAIIGAMPLCVQNRNGVLDRMKIMEITNYKLQLVHWMTRTLFILVQTLLLLASAIVYLKVEFSAYQFFTGWFVIALQTLCGFSFGILLFGILKKRVPIILSLIVLEFIISSLSGFLWNYHGLSPIFQKLTIVFPHHAVSKLLFEVIIHERSVAQNNIWFGFVSPLFWTLSTFIFYCVYTASHK